jgi:23S rRNA (adenine1618-N6)-methyltransferase
LGRGKNKAGNKGKSFIPVKSEKTKDAAKDKIAKLAVKNRMSELSAIVKKKATKTKIEDNQPVPEAVVVVDALEATPPILIETAENAPEPIVEDKKKGLNLTVEKKARKGLHEKNPFRAKYDFDVLIQQTPELAAFVGVNSYKVRTIDFSNPQAVLCLNRALLKHHYQIEFWNIPEGYLCPPVPGRADYLHYAADLLKESNKGKLPDGKTVKVLDIGTGANCIYPIIGNRTFKWKFVGSEVDPLAIECANSIVKNNQNLANSIEIREQEVITNIFHGVVQEGDYFDLTVCNPPFFDSIESATKSNSRKLKNLKIDSSNNALNFGGQNTEFWTKGGEKMFIQKMIKQSVAFSERVLWFTTLVSKSRNLPYLLKRLEQAKAVKIENIEMSQGQKTSHLLCWSFQSKKQHKEWFSRLDDKPKEKQDTKEDEVVS